MFVYVLQSERDGKLYIGQTMDVEKRLERHNENPSRAMKGRVPFRLLGTIQVDTRAEAMQLEKKIKALKSREAVLKSITKV